MINLKLFFGLAVVLAVLCSNTSSQDFPTSLGPAPMVYNQIPSSEVFTDMDVGSRQYTYVNLLAMGKGFLSSCTLTPVGSPPPGLLGACARHTNGTIYASLQGTPFTLFTVDTTTGVLTALGAITGIPPAIANLTGMTWDGTQMWGIATSCAVSQIGTINLTTRVFTPLGSTSPICACAIGISAAPNGTLFAVDIVADNLYKYNKLTGVPTLVGSTGLALNNAQDGHFDLSDGKLYWAAYVPATASLRVIDTTTGAAGPVLCTYANEVIAMAVKPLVTAPPLTGVISICKYNARTKPIIDVGTMADTILAAINPQSRILDVNVRLDTILHTFDADMDITLDHGAITNLDLSSDNGGSGDNYIACILNDSAATSITTAVAPMTGSYRPEAVMTGWNNTSPNGIWRLQIVDDLGGDVGYLVQWCVTIMYDNLLAAGNNNELIPKEYTLLQNYPNPFNPETRITYTLPNAEIVKLIVYDMLGKEVLTLQNGFKPAGIHIIDYNASDLASGVYFYRIEAGKFTDVKKMLLVK